MLKKFRIWLFFKAGEGVACGPFSACEGGWVDKEVRGRELGSLLPLLIPEYGQQTTGGKSAAFTLSPHPRRWAAGTARQREPTERWWSPGRRRAGVSSPLSNLPTPRGGAAEYTCPPLTHRDGSMRSQLTQRFSRLYLGLGRRRQRRSWLKHTVIPHTITRIHLGGARPPLHLSPLNPGSRREWWWWAEPLGWMRARWPNTCRHVANSAAWIQ